MYRYLQTGLGILILLAAAALMLTGCREQAPKKEKNLSVYTFSSTIKFTKTLPDGTTSQEELVLLKDYPLVERGFGSVGGVDFKIEYNRYGKCFGVWIGNNYAGEHDSHFEMTDTELTITVSDGTTHTVTVGSGRLACSGSEFFSIPSPRLMD